MDMNAHKPRVPKPPPPPAPPRPYGLLPRKKADVVVSDLPSASDKTRIGQQLLANWRAPNHPPENSKPSDVPELPDGLTLGEIGFKVWCKLTRLFQKNGTFTEQMKHPLYTLCALEEMAFHLRQEYIGRMTVPTMTGEKLNPAIAEWGKVVNLLKAYYAEFQCTPRSTGAVAVDSSNPNNKPIPDRKHVLGSDPGVIFTPDQQAAATL